MYTKAFFCVCEGCEHFVNVRAFHTHPRVSYENSRALLARELKLASVRAFQINLRAFCERVRGKTSKCESILLDSERFVLSR